jgi:fatty acid desaturase
MINPIPTKELKQLYQQRWLPNLKIPLFYVLWIALGMIAWNSPHWIITWLCYLAMGYMQMGIMTFMHDCTHSVLFKAKWKNLAFGIFAIIPMFISFISFKEDHLLHHRHNRSAKDPDAFTMGKRGISDYILFYAYALIGVLLTAIQFTFIYPIQKFRGAKALIHWSEIALHIIVGVAIFYWASSQGIAAEVFAVWFWPLVFFGFFNSIRFVAEHYGTPWNSGQLTGTRTIISNPVNSWFWNNINYHIGHHVYPAVPWYNLQKLHVLLLPEIKRQNAIVAKSYLAVFFDAMARGPESPQQNVAFNAERAVKAKVPVPLP